MADSVVLGRDAFDRQAWGRAYEHLSAAAENEALEVPDLERLASAAYLVGRSKESLETWASAYHECARAGDIPRAARCAFWLAFALLNGGELDRGGGWVNRAQRLLDARQVGCVEQGYLRYAAALRSTFSGDLPLAHAGFVEAVAMGTEFGDAELVTLARIGEGRCTIYLGNVDQGLALLDEAVVAVGEQEISAIAVGDSYCTVIDGCYEVFDVRRTREWTNALGEWCAAQPELVLYRGECLIHQAEVLQLSGAWDVALEHLESAQDRIVAPLYPRIIAAASYLRADILRLRGDFHAAEEGYRTCHEAGGSPQPGMALLRLAQGRIDVANTAIRRSLQEVERPMGRVRLLGAFIDIALQAGDVTGARTASDELSAHVEDFAQPYLAALSAQMAGSVSLAQDNSEEAVLLLRRAWRMWRDLGMPYEAARMRMQLALACQALGDADGAQMELDAARSAFVTLGATPDVHSIDLFGNRDSREIADGLTSREVEVLVLVAKDQTNRQIAHELGISERTIASHLSHIFTKLDLPSRAAATAYVYEHRLV